VRLYSRPGNDFTRRFPLIAEALTSLRSRSCIIDGEAVACDDKGLASFERIRYRQHDGDVFLYAFDLIELNGDDLRRDPLEVRKATLASILAKARSGIRFNEHIEGDGPTVFAHACKMGLEGIVSKAARLTLPFWKIDGLAQVQEPGGSGCEARRGRGLGQMTRTHSLPRERWGDARRPRRAYNARRRISLGEAPNSRQMRSLPQGPRGEELGSRFSRILVPGLFT
jgi:bifunctional non-homologous end joining protein LigD